MQTRTFHAILYYDPGRADSNPEEGKINPYLQAWLQTNPDAKILQLVENVTYEEPTPMFNGKIHVVTTIIYE